MPEYKEQRSSRCGAVYIREGGVWAKVTDDAGITQTDGQFGWAVLIAILSGVVVFRYAALLVGVIAVL